MYVETYIRNVKSVKIYFSYALVQPHVCHRSLRFISNQASLAKEEQYLKSACVTWFRSFTTLVKTALKDGDNAIIHIL